MSNVAEPSILTTQTPAVREYAQEYADFLYSSPTSYHCADQAGQMLAEGGFVEVDRREDWPTEPGRYFVVEDGALVAWVQFEGALGFSLTATHTDSPALKLKPLPQMTSSDGWGQIMVETYGGPL